ESMWVRVTPSKQPSDMRLTISPSSSDYYEGKCEMQLRFVNDLIYEGDYNHLQEIWDFNTCEGDTVKEKFENLTGEIQVVLDNIQYYLKSGVCSGSMPTEMFVGLTTCAVLETLDVGYIPAEVTRSTVKPDSQDVVLHRGNCFGMRMHVVPDLEDKIKRSNYKDIVDHPERRTILLDTLGYDDLDKFSKKDYSRGGRRLAMDYKVNPATVIILKATFEAFMGKSDNELEDASIEMQKRLLHEAAHIWGYKEDPAEEFALGFLRSARGEDTRPTNLEVKSDFCACIDGKSDIINNCDSFCETKPVTSRPILYANIVNIIGNPLIKNVHDWCTRQIAGDQTGPGCSLQAIDEYNNNISMEVTTSAGSNQFTVDIQNLQKARTYILKLVESKSGSNAQTETFQINRKSLPPPEDDTLGALLIAPINQYTCFNYGIDYSENRNGYARKFYYFSDAEFPAAMPPVSPGRSAVIVCHDEILHPGNDSILYERLEKISQLYPLWDKNDSRFTMDGTRPIINSIIQKRLYDEYRINSSIDLFRNLNGQTSPNSSSPGVFLGYMMVPFKNTSTGKTYCPTTADFNGTDPVLNILGDYMDDTEGLYIAEKEPEVIIQYNETKTIYGTMYVTQSSLLNYGFYLENGLKIRIDNSTLHTKAVHFYWPFSSTEDPLVSGGRKLFSVKSVSAPGTTDKRIGCIPKAGK
ncbi:MAG: hypothetical protein K2Q18_05055, partial [Bdellovibrionales bacterium]|nr:hypothetical protein [Bdellovibrionales bacterium]